VADGRGERRSRIVGRDSELARVGSLLDDALAGRGRLILCTGEAGIGKTRVAEEIAALAAARGAAVVWTRATDPGSSPPYGLWRLAVDSLGTGPADDLWSAAVGPRPPSGPGSDVAGSQRFALFSQLRRRLADAAEEHGLVLVVDDLQWADEASLALLVDVGRQLRGMRVLIVATNRDGTIRLPEALVTDTDLERVALNGLRPEAVGDLLAAAGLAASSEQVAEIHLQTGGNPFLVREMGRAVAEHEDAVPARVLQVTAFRLSHLSTAAQELLGVAAVAGNGFPIGVVAKMLDQPVLALLEPLEESTAAGFVVPGDRAGDYRFSHALIHTAALAGMPAAEQRRVHASAADAIEALFEGRQGPHLADIARHRVAASVPGDRAGAVTACEAAAVFASETWAYEEATRLYRQALALSDGGADSADATRLELALSAALYRSGDLAGSHRTALAVGKRAERARDATTLAQTALVMEATGEPAWDAAMARICEAALASGDLPAPVTARVLARYGQVLAYRNEATRANEVSLEALSAADAADDPAALVEALHARQLARCGPDGLAERTNLAERMLRAGLATGNAWVEMWGRLWRIDTLFETGQLTTVRRELVDLEQCIQRLPGPLGRWHYLHTAATLAMATARFGEARRLAEEGYEVFQVMGHPVAFGACAVVLGQAGMHIGFEASGQTALFESLPPQFAPDVTDTTASISSVFPALSMALMAMQLGDRAGAERAYGLAGPPASWLPSPALLLSVWGHGLPVAIELGRTDDVEFLAGQFEPFRGQHVANGAGSGVYMGPIELRLGQAYAALGLLDQAVSDLEHAAAVCSANGARGYAVEASVDLAAALLRRAGADSDADRAATILDRAAAEADHLAMAPYLARIATLRGTDPSTPAASASTSPALPLTAREGDVAALVARGLTNKQIAETLFISERTAENHVQHILTKLGLANRTQIATWVPPSK